MNGGGGQACPHRSANGAGMLPVGRRRTGAVARPRPAARTEGRVSNATAKTAAPGRSRKARGAAAAAASATASSRAVVMWVNTGGAPRRVCEPIAIKTQRFYLAGGFCASAALSPGEQCERCHGLIRAASPAAPMTPSGQDRRAGREAPEVRRPSDARPAPAGVGWQASPGVVSSVSCFRVAQLACRQLRPGGLPAQLTRPARTQLGKFPYLAGGRVSRRAGRVSRVYFRAALV